MFVTLQVNRQVTFQDARIQTSRIFLLMFQTQTMCRTILTTENSEICYTEPSFEIMDLEQT